MSKSTFVSVVLQAEAVRTGSNPLGENHGVDIRRNIGRKTRGQKCETRTGVHV